MNKEKEKKTFGSGSEKRERERRGKNPSCKTIRFWVHQFLTPKGEDFILLELSWEHHEIQTNIHCITTADRYTIHQSLLNYSIEII